MKTGEIKYLFDENVDVILKKALLSREPEIIALKIGEPGLPPNGTKDPDILNWCEENEFILVTNNRASMPVHISEHIANGGHISGIIELNPGMSINETVKELKLNLGRVNDKRISRYYFVFTC